MAGQKKISLTLVVLLTAVAGGAVQIRIPANALPEAAAGENSPLENYDRKFSAALVSAAKERTKHRVTYDGSYRKIGYPNGDVPDSIGVCADVVVRAYRRTGIDLQRQIHEDMKGGFDLYPDRWGLKKPDPNIDHRRVPNLRVFFERHGITLAPTWNRNDYLPGDLVTWTVAGRLPHIGIVSDRYAVSGRPLIIHNIGRGPVLEDMLFDYPITGHYRYYGP